MIDISYDGVITISRGDTIRMPLFINAGSSVAPVRYQLTDKDKIYVGVCEPNQSFENAIIRQTYTSDDWEINENGDLVVTMSPEETEYLLAGQYYYIVKMVSTNDKGKEIVQTIIPKKKLFIED